MECLLGSVDLLEFVQETSINSQDTSRGAIALFLIILALDDNLLSSILHEYGQIHNAKIFWDILEMKYNMQWGEKAYKDEGRALLADLQENSEIVERNILEDLAVANELKKFNSLFEVEVVNSTTMVTNVKEEFTKFDDQCLFYENELQVIFENNLIDKPLFAIDKEEEYEEEIVAAIKGTRNFEDAKTNYDAEIKFIEEWVEKPFEQIDAGLKAVARTVKALENEHNGKSMNDSYDMELKLVVDTFEEVTGILIYWSLEEIKHYYGLMRKQPSKQETIDDENELVEKGAEMDWFHPTWNKKQYPYFMIWSKKKTKHVESVRVWSSKLKKKFHQYVDAKKVKMKSYL